MDDILNRRRRDREDLSYPIVNSRWWTVTIWLTR